MLLRSRYCVAEPLATCTAWSLGLGCSPPVAGALPRLAASDAAKPLGETSQLTSSSTMSSSTSQQLAATQLFGRAAWRGSITRAAEGTSQAAASLLPMSMCGVCLAVGISVLLLHCWDLSRDKGQQAVPCDSVSQQVMLTPTAGRMCMATGSSEAALEHVQPTANTTSSNLSADAASEGLPRLPSVQASATKTRLCRLEQVCVSWLLGRLHCS